VDAKRPPKRYGFLVEREVAEIHEEMTERGLLHG